MISYNLMVGVHEDFMSGFERDKLILDCKSGGKL